MKSRKPAKLRKSRKIGEIPKIKEKLEKRGNPQN
jgi:hypothetical protein